MKKYSLEFVVGVFVLFGLLCVAYLTVRLGKMEIFAEESYSLSASFSSISGLKSGGDVQLAGVSVGKISSISLAPDYQATVIMSIRSGVELSDDSSAAIKTSGLIGDKYISLAPGGSSLMLADGDEIVETHAPVDIENLISNYVFGSVK